MYLSASTFSLALADFLFAFAFGDVAVVAFAFGDFAVALGDFAAIAELLRQSIAVFVVAYVEISSASFARTQGAKGAQIHESILCRAIHPLRRVQLGNEYYTVSEFTY